MMRSRPIMVLLVAAALAGCATTERISAAGDVHTLLIAIRDNDHKAFNAHVDRPALEAQIQAKLVDEAKGANLNDGIKGLGVAFSGALAHAAGAIFIQPEVFRAVADYYGYKPDTPIPNTLELAGRPQARGRRPGLRHPARGTAALTFADEAGVWRLVSFDGDAAMLRLGRSRKTPPSWGGRSVGPGWGCLKRPQRCGLQCGSPP